MFESFKDKAKGNREYKESIRIAKFSFWFPAEEMMNQGVLQRSPVQQQQMMANWWNINNMRPPISAAQPTPFLLPPSNLFPHYAPPPPPSPPTSWNNNQELPESWSQLLLGGLVGEEEKTGLGHIQAKNLENWEEGQLLHLQPSNAPATWSQMIPPSASSPKSCVTSLSSNMLDFSSNKADGRHPPPDRSAECNSTASGGALKKARVHQPSSTQSTFKVQVRKEKLGDRITALHQLVSPFGKTDTASVLLEAIGYIRFLQSQIEALSLPYLASGSENMRQQQQSLQGERNCLFPEDPGQLLNDNCMKRKGSSDEQDSHEDPKKDLRSRGLCLVPISCTLQVGSDNGADYWAPALGGGFR